MLKFKLETLDGVDESIAKMYESREGAFFLKLEGGPVAEDVTGLKSKIAELLDEKKSEADKRKTAEEAAKKAADDKARSENDYESLAKSLQAKNDELSGQLGVYAKKDETAALNSAAASAAAELTTDASSAKLLTRFLKDRLRYEEGDVKVTDEKGSLTIATLKDLVAEFRKNPDFATLIVQTNASGGGANGGSGGAAGKKFTDLTTAEKVALRQESPETYDRLKAAG